MKFEFLKKAQTVLIVGAIIHFVSFILFALEIIDGSLLLTAIPCLVTLVEGLILMLFAIHLQNLDAIKWCKRVGRYELIVMPLFVVLILLLCFLFPASFGTPIYFINIGTCVVLFGTRVFISIFMDKIMQHEKLDAYVVLRNHSWIGASLMLLLVIFYVMAPIKLSGIEAFAEYVMLEDEDVINDAAKNFVIVYVLTTLGQMLFSIIVFLEMLFMAMSTLFSGLENQAVDFRGNLAVSKRILRKYDVMFWFGIASTSFLMILAIISAYQFSSLRSAYVSLAILYFSIIAIRFPTWFWKRKIEKSGSSRYEVFRQKHRILVYAASALLLYSLFALLFGNAFEAKMEAEKTDFMTFGIFVPWAVFKIFSSTKSYLTAKKIGDPTMLMNSYIDVLISMFTLISTLFLISNALNNLLVKFISIIIYVLMLLYSFYISIKLLVIGIRGLKNKRITYYRLHVAYAAEGNAENGIESRLEGDLLEGEKFTPNLDDLEKVVKPVTKIAKKAKKKKKDS